MIPRPRHSGAALAAARHALLAATACLALVAAPCGTAHALIIDFLETDGNGDPIYAPVNTSAPVDDPTTPLPEDPGWFRLPDDRSGVYLGNQWMLTATHTRAVNTIPGKVELNGITYNTVPGSRVVIRNPTGQGMTTDSDLLMYRIAPAANNGLAPEDDPENAISSDTHSGGVVTLSQSTLASGTEVVMIGSGVTRILNTDDPRGRTTFTDYQGSPRGLLSPGATSPLFDANEKTWGTNSVVNANLAFGGGTSLTATARIGSQDVIAQVVRFDDVDPSGTQQPTYEAQARKDDSGGPVFVQQGGEWRLAGVLHAFVGSAKSPTNGQPVFQGRDVLFGDFTAFTDISNSHYRGQIEALLQNDFDTFESLTGASISQTGYSIPGDINLDGVVSGDGTGDPTSDDVAAFVAGWGYTVPEGQTPLNPALPGDIYSWMNGDLNLDGTTDELDFIALRSALGSGGASLQLSSLLNVPEPTSAALLAVLPLFAPRRRR